MKLLIVEDNEMNRDILTRRLEWKDDEVIHATGGEEALQKVSEESDKVS